MHILTAHRKSTRYRSLMVLSAACAGFSDRDPAHVNERRTSAVGTVSHARTPQHTHLPAYSRTS
ncbi:hypothetical protein BC834DRAFT_870388 [Gloeopeniophorella convolvens]|nr:hypothetical protein BC834DRAFT_870388 [Gloeopeniophorella convolvens]